MPEFFFCCQEVEERRVINFLWLSIHVEISGVSCFLPARGKNKTCIVHKTMWGVGGRFGYYLRSGIRPLGGPFLATQFLQGLNREGEW